jgi:sigma-E factor negative regulatory protein RseC
MDNLTEYGQVVDVRGGVAQVKFTRTSACGKCHACGMLSTQNEIVVQVNNDYNAAVGDLVGVSIRMKKAMRASVLAYVFPLIMLILGVLFGWLLTEQWHVFENADTTMAISAIIFAVLSFFLLKLAAPLYNKSVSNVYRMVGKK